MSKADEEDSKRVAHMVAWTNARIKEVRENRGWTQAKLSAEMSVASTRIGDFENGRFELKVTTLFRLMRAMGITPTEFFRDCPSWDPPKKVKKDAK